MLTALGWLALLALIGANAFFVASEFSLTSVDRAKLSRRAQSGDHRAQVVQRTVRELSYQLSAAQLGITVCSLLLGFVAEPVVATALRPVVRSVGLPHGSVDAIAVVLALVLATGAQMLFGELLPQNLAIARPLQVARIIVPIQRGFARAGRPLIRLFDNTANAIVRALGIVPKQELRAARTPTEFATIIASSAQEGSLAAPTAELLRRALSFGTKTAADIMTPRVRVVALREQDSINELLSTARTSGRSRFPVQGEDLDDVVGVIHVKHGFAVPREQRADTAIRSLMVDPVRVPESLDCDALLQRLSRGRMQLGVVVDEYGGTAGVVTMEDLIEELVGQIRDEHDAAEIPEVVLRGDRRWSVSGQLHKDTLADLLAIEAPAGPFDTVAGLVLERLGRVPDVGDAIELDGWHLRVSRMDARRVDRIEVQPAGAQRAGGQPG
ncbi:MAG: hemolysin family protein [Jatrophihabitantaceae bacterium]